jgi:hypothetical protein
MFALDTPSSYLIEPARKERNKKKIASFNSLEQTKDVQNYNRRHRARVLTKGTVVQSLFSVASSAAATRHAPQLPRTEKQVCIKKTVLS